MKLGSKKTEQTGSLAVATGSHSEDPAELVRRELARRFYSLLKTHGNSERVTVDFSALPRYGEIAMPQPPTMLVDKAPPTINALDLLAKTLPGLWGYAEAAGMRTEEVCTRCGKCFPANTSGETRRGE